MQAGFYFTSGTSLSTSHSIVLLREVFDTVCDWQPFFFTKRSQIQRVIGIHTAS